MRTGHLLFSAAQFLFSLLIMLIGVLLIGMEYAPHLKYAIARFFEEDTRSLLSMGLVVLGSGILLLMGFCAMHRGLFYRVKMGGQEVTIDGPILRAYVDSYWKKMFPELSLATEVVVSSKQKIEVFVEMPPLPFEEQEQVIKKAEEELPRFFSKHVGYQSSFIVNIMVK
jgi:hypothetical protein